MAVDFVYSRQNMIAEELERSGRRIFRKGDPRNGKAAGRFESKNAGHDLSAGKAGAWPADAGGAEKAGGPEKAERPGRRKAETQFQRKIGVTGLRAKVEPGSALDQEAWRDEKVRSWRYGLYP